MSQHRSLEQERAKMAWECVSNVKGKDYEKEYRQLARSAPADIQSNGLGQTLAFFRARGFEKSKPKSNGQNAHYQLLEHISEWLRKQLGPDQKEKNLVKWISTDANTNQYRRATAEAIAFLNWLKRFAEAELGGD